MKQFLFGFVAALLLIAAAGLGYVALGLAPVATALFVMDCRARIKPRSPRGSFPSPRELLNGQGVTNDPVGVTYWKVANGIRLTGMPGFNGSLSAAQMWQVSLLLSNANKLPATVVSALKEPLVLQ